MALMLYPTNLLHLCDDIQEKIGKEIKYIRIQKDAKKRYNFIKYEFNCMNSREVNPIADFTDVKHFINNMNVWLFINLKNLLKYNYGNGYPDLHYIYHTDFLDDLNDTLQPQINEYITYSKKLIKFYINGNDETSEKLIKEVIDGYDSDDSDYCDAPDEDSLTAGPEECLEWKKQCNRISEADSGEDTSDEED